MKYQCINCQRIYNNLDELKSKTFCAFCGDNVRAIPEPEDVKNEQEKQMDLNKDGKLDQKDVTIANKVIDSFKKKKVGKK